MCTKTAYLALAVIALLVGSAWADLAPGTVLFRPGWQPITGDNVGEYTQGPTPGGELLATLVSDAVGVTPATTLQAKVTTNVYRRDDGGLTFEYSFSDFADGPSLVRATLGGQWAGVGIADAGADASGMSQVPPDSWITGDPYYLERGSVAQGAAPWIQWAAFGIGSPLEGDEASSRVWFATDATDYRTSTAHMIDTTVGSDVAIFSPVPVPGALALGAIGLGLIGWVQRRRM